MLFKEFHHVTQHSNTAAPPAEWDVGAFVHMHIVSDTTERERARKTSN